jgi:hypothetical protein
MKRGLGTQSLTPIFHWGYAQIILFLYPKRTYKKASAKFAKAK